MSLAETDFETSAPPESRTLGRITEVGSNVCSAVFPVVEIEGQDCDVAVQTDDLRGSGVELAIDGYFSAEVNLDATTADQVQPHAFQALARDV